MKRWLGWYPVRVAAVADTAVLALWCLVLGLVPMQTGPAAAGLLMVVVPTTFVALCCTRTSAARWALAAGVQFSPMWEVVLHRHLTRTRVARTLGVTCGFAVGFMLVAHYNAGPESFRWFTEVWNPHLNGYWLAALGYTAGSLWAEWTKPDAAIERPSGTAVLSRRRLVDFTDRAVREFLTFSLVVVAFATLLARFLPRTDGMWGDPIIRPPWGALAAAIAAVTAVVGANWVCRRREQAGDEAALAYEELTRAATANALLGVSIAMLGEIASDVIGSRTADGTVSFWVQLPFGAFALLCLGVWIGSGTKLAIRNRRIGKLRAAAGVASA
ncbi:MAG: hypothetical protein M3Y51_06435 [Actinomycetota bacterium]|nr:hypothetical protein [Actinomycetota bacterium]